MSFRDDGAAALEWAASYLERVREFPVLAQVEPGEIRQALPESPSLQESQLPQTEDLPRGIRGNRLHSGRRRRRPPSH